MLKMASSSRDSTVGMTVVIIAAVSLVAVIIACAVLQLVGFEGKKWARTEQCESISLQEMCCLQHNTSITKCVSTTKGFGDVVFQCHRFAAIVYWGTFFGFVGVLFILCDNDNIIYLLLLALGVLCYPAAAIASLVGSVVAASKYGHSNLSSSYQCCLAASIISCIGILIGLSTGLFVCWFRGSCRTCCEER